MKTYTIEDIRNLKPCYDPNKYLPEDWTGTAIDILQIKKCPPEDRLWVILYWLDDRTKRLFAVWCARRALCLVDNSDPRSIAACDIAERYANGEATAEELAAARAAAWAAARAAAWAAAWDASRAASRDAARAAAWAAAWDAARAAAWTASRAAAWDAQIEHLVEMLEAA